MKKVSQNSKGAQHCDFCNERIKDIDFRYLLSVDIEDKTRTLSMSTFNEVGNDIFNVLAKDLHTWQEKDSPKFKNAIDKAMAHQYMYKLEIKEGSYQGIFQLKCTMVKATRKNNDAKF